MSNDVPISRRGPVMLGLVVGAGAWWLAGVARADPLPAPTLSQSFSTYTSACDIGPGNCTEGSGGTFIVNTSGGSAGANTASITHSSTLTPAPVLTLDGAFNAPVPGNGEVASFDGAHHLTYAFRINGPGGAVPIRIWADGLVQGNFDSSPGRYITAGAVSMLQIYGVGFSFEQSLGAYYENTYNSIISTSSYGNTELGPLGGITSNDTGFTGSFSVRDVYSLQANEVYTVTMVVQAYGSTFSAGGSGVVRAYLDPIFTVDPTFQEAGFYSVEVSPGVGNRTIVPEPATWALLIVGFGGAGASLRRPRTPAQA